MWACLFFGSEPYSDNLRLKLTDTKIFRCICVLYSGSLYDRLKGVRIVNFEFGKNETSICYGV